MSENNTEQKPNLDSKQMKASLKSKLQSRIQQKKVGRMTNKQRQQQMDIYMKKMGITPEQVDQMKEIFHKQSKP